MTCFIQYLPVKCFPQNNFLLRHRRNGNHRLPVRAIKIVNNKTIAAQRHFTWRYPITYKNNITAGIHTANMFRQTDIPEHTAPARVLLQPHSDILRAGKRHSTDNLHLINSVLFRLIIVLSVPKRVSPALYKVSRAADQREVTPTVTGNGNTMDTGHPTMLFFRNNPALISMLPIPPMLLAVKRNTNIRNKQHHNRNKETDNEIFFLRFFHAKKDTYQTVYHTGFPQSGTGVNYTHNTKKIPPLVLNGGRKRSFSWR